MKRIRTCIAVSIAAGWLLGHAAPSLSAGEPPWQKMIEEFADPNRMFERLFGEETEQDRQALAQIEVSAREERQMGQQAVEAYLASLRQQGIRVVTRGKEVTYLRDLVDTIRPLMSQPRRYRTIRIYLAQSSRCDARSFPGGSLVFFRGLLENAGSEAAVVGIVGHELSHLDRGHHLWRARRLKLAQQTFSGQMGKFSPQQFFTSGTTIARLWTRPFRPEFEAEADRDGATWAYRAGYDPREMGELFLKLRRQRPENPIPLPSFMQSHPPAEDRHREILAVYEKLQQAEPNAKPYIGRENLRRQIARSRRVYPE